MNVLEEAYEVMEAIDADDDAMLKEELGDLLFQAVFHCQIEDERGRFCFDDICDDVAKKMIYRHPHVFGDVKVSNSDDVLKNWDKLKKKSKNQETVADTLDSVPMVLPALMRGQKVCKRASNAGVEITDADVSLEIVKKKLAELELAISDKNEQETEAKFGELDMINRDLLIAQLKAMETYLSILSIRLGINGTTADTNEAVEDTVTEDTEVPEVETEVVNPGE